MNATLCGIGHNFRLILHKIDALPTVSKENFSYKEENLPRVVSKNSEKIHEKYLKNIRFSWKKFFLFINIFTCLFV